MDQRTARVGKNNRAQIVTIPLEYRFPEGMNDLMIAAHARSLGAIPVTNNVKDFRRVKGLKHQNWME